MVFGVNEVGVDAGFLESGFNGFLHLFFFGFFYSHIELGVDGSLRNGFAVDCHGIHGGNLHGYVAHHLKVDAFLIE